MEDPQTMSQPPSADLLDLLKQKQMPGGPSTGQMPPDLSIPMQGQASPDQMPPTLESPDQMPSPTSESLPDSQVSTLAGETLPHWQSPVLSPPPTSSEPLPEQPKLPQGLDKNPLLRLLHGPISLEELPGQPLVDELAGDWLDNPDQKVASMLQDLAQQEANSPDKPLIPDFWQGSPEKFLEEFQQSLSTVDQLDKQVNQSQPNQAYANRLKAGLSRGHQPTDISSLLVTLSAGEASQQQLKLLELLLDMWHELHSPLISPETPTPAL